MSSPEYESMRDWVRRAITERGVEATIHGIAHGFQKMCHGTRIKREFHGNGHIIARGYDHFDPDKLEEAVRWLIEELPTGKIRTELEADLAFWQENRQEIMDDHRVTPA